MKPGIRKLINFLFIGVTIALVCILAFGNSDLENAWEARVGRQTHIKTFSYITT